ncbi:hypothetical protein E1B28_007306 [Marasmius oreades]|nr:uncharacterized protein E1B28_007306 [Marasmius oreades]KAG7093643.1 hypothetical protein E1B28_007306 [Marasmius oreades]
MRPPDSPSSKKLEFKVPEVSYQRQRCDSKIPDSVANEKKTSHIRSKSSLKSLKQLKVLSSSPSSSIHKPVFRSHKPNSSVSLKNPTPSNSEFDDDASVAESILSTTKVRRTEAERIEYFKNQPEASDVEPYHVICLRCKKTVNLRKRQTYSVKPWEIHRARCDAKVPSGLFDETSTHTAKENDNKSQTGTTTTTTRTKTTEAERKTILECEAADVKPDEALCKRCKKWIRLGNGNSKYSLGNWSSHQARCGGVVPSSRVATAERKLRIVNDPRAKAFGPRHVECVTCGKSIVLEGEADYTLASWEKHKTECPNSDTSAKQVAPETCSAPNGVPMPPPSVESSSTVVSPEGAESSGPQKSGVKRCLEEETEDATEPPSIRPRTEVYAPSEKEAPSALGWFLLPFRSFIRGFKESLS